MSECTLLSLHDVVQDGTSMFATFRFTLSIKLYETEASNICYFYTFSMAITNNIQLFLNAYQSSITPAPINHSVHYIINTTRWQPPTPPTICLPWIGALIIPIMEIRVWNNQYFSAPPLRMRCATQPGGGKTHGAPWRKSSDHSWVGFRPRCTIWDQRCGQPGHWDPHVSYYFNTVERLSKGCPINNFGSMLYIDCYISKGLIIHIASMVTILDYTKIISFLRLVYFKLMQMNSI